jgi:hypothetical protein
MMQSLKLGRWFSRTGRVFMDRDSERVGDTDEALYSGSVRGKANTPADESHVLGVLAARVPLPHLRLCMSVFSQFRG